MTRLLISTAVAALLALGGSALAQGHPGGRDNDGRSRPAQAAPQPAPQAAPAAPAARGRDFDHRGQRPGAAPAAPPAANNAMRGPAPNAMRGPGNNAMRGPGNNAMRGQGNAQRRDFSSYHRNFSAPRRYRAPSNYRRPNGWYAHRWTFGQILPSLFWQPNYWLNDYNDFGLSSPPPGTVWVRDGDDALLIDRYSGEIIQVAYGVFY